MTTKPNYGNKIVFAVKLCDEFKKQSDSASVTIGEHISDVIGSSTFDGAMDDEETYKLVLTEIDELVTAAYWFKDRLKKGANS